MSPLYRRSSDGAAAGDAVPFVQEGRHHLFHLSCPGDSLGQQYPYRCTTQQRHIVSDDLLTWKELPTALVPGEDYDRDGCWTGCAIEKDGRCFLFYTGHVAGAANPQTICLAVSDDLESFQKVADNPLITPDPAVFEPIDFRDPYVFFNDAAGEYWMLIAARLASGPSGRRGTIALSTSADLLTWTAPEPFYSPNSTFCPECPEMFSLGGHWYLVYSHFSETARTTYRVSDSSRGPWRVPAVPGVDGRRFYAAKSAPDGDRRLMWGTIYERIGLDDSSDWTYGGDFGVLRELRAAADGTLHVSLPDEIRSAFTPASALELSAVSGDWQFGDRAQVDATAQFAHATAPLPDSEGPILLTTTMRRDEGNGEFGLLLYPTDDLTQTHAIVFDPTQNHARITMWPQPLDPFWAVLTEAKTPPAQIDGSAFVARPVDLAPGRDITVTVILDGSIVEIFIDDRVALSYRLYDTERRVVGIYAQDASITVDPVRFAALS